MCLPPNQLCLSSPRWRFYSKVGPWGVDVVLGWHLCGRNNCLREFPGLFHHGSTQREGATCEPANRTSPGRHKSASILNLDQASRTEKSISVVQVMAFEYSGLDGPKHFLTLTIIPSQQQATKKLYRPAALTFLQYN